MASLLSSCDDENDENLCAICLIPLSSGPAAKTPCGHTYHQACVAQLDEYKIEACPLCRTPLPPGPARTFEEAFRRFIPLFYRYGHDATSPWRTLSSTDHEEMVEVLRMFRDAANQGHAQATYNMAMACNTGLGDVPRDDLAAIEWYRKAAEEQDYPPAMNNLANAYILGVAGQKDDAAGLKWMRKVREE